MIPSMYSSRCFILVLYVYSKVNTMLQLFLWVAYTHHLLWGATDNRTRENTAVIPQEPKDDWLY